MYPSLEKRGKGRFFNNDALLMNFLVYDHSCESRDPDSVRKQELINELDSFFQKTLDSASPDRSRGQASAE
jgi:hypothetical protein